LAGSWPYPEIKDFSETNALAYFVPPSATKKKFYNIATRNPEAGFGWNETTREDLRDGYYRIRSGIKGFDGDPLLKG